MEDSEHFLLDCKKYEAQRKKLREELEQLGIQSVTLKSILGGKSPPVGTVMSFFEECKNIK